MYPLAPIPAVEDIKDWNEAKGLNPSEVMDLMQTVYVRGLLKQFQSLNTFAVQLFKDISNDVKIIKERTTTLSRKITTVKADSVPKIRKLMTKKSDAFMKGSPKDISIEPLPFKDPNQPGQKMENLTKILPVPMNDLNFEAFRGVGRVTDPDEIKKRISNPSILMDQYIEELTNQLNEMEEPTKSTKSALVKQQTPNFVLTQQESDAMISAYLGTPRSQDRVLITPPPVGKAKGWREFAHTMPARGAKNHAEEQEVIPQHERKPREPKKPRPVHVPKPKPQPKPPITLQSSSSQQSSGGPPPPSNLPPPPPPPPPPSNLPPPPPPPTAGGAKAQTTPKAAAGPKTTPAPAADDSNSGDFLALIKKGNFVLKKVDVAEEAKKPPVTAGGGGGADIAELLLMEMQRRREGIKSSESESEDNDSDSESDW